MVDGPGLLPSLAILAAAIASAGLANWQSRRPLEHRIRGIPWLGIQFLALAICLVMVAHLVSVLGGHAFRGRSLGY